MRRPLGLLLVCLLGCERNGLRTVIGDVEVAPAALHFETGWLGFPKTRLLTLRNGSRGDRHLTVSSAAPFSAPEEVLVPGGSQVEVKVVFAPEVEGRAEGTLTLSDGVHTLKVALDGLGAVAPVCIPSAACRLSRFDGDHCVESIAADGSACASASACLEGGTCSAGTCVGTARDCADTNPCTDDACEPGGGCVHYPKVCGAPADPCKVASCDPVLGCVESDAADGTACGPADCVTARICLSGACKSVAVPDGATCSPATACQGVGTCQQQQCVRPDPLPLTEAWSHPFAGTRPTFRGITDAAQNLYFLDCGGGGEVDSCAVVSLARDGAVRFSQVLPEIPNYSVVPHLLAGGHLAYALGGDVGAVSSSSGALEWTLPLAGALQGGPDLADLLWVRFLVADAAGQLYVGIQRNETTPQGPARRQDALLKVDARTGAVVLRRFFDAETAGAIVDEHDNLYLGAWVVGVGPQLFSLSPSGAERFRLTVMGEPTPVAAYNGEVTLQRGEVRSTLDGSIRATAPVGWPMPGMLMSSTGRTFVHQPQNYGCCETCECKVPAFPEVDLISFAPGVSSPRWETPIATTSGVSNYVSTSELLAARQGDVLLSVSTVSTLTQLVALTSEGSQRFSCDIPPGPQGALGYASYGGATALVAGRWAVVEQIECRNCTHNPLPTLRVFEVPGVWAATRGWVSGAGGPSGAGRPLP